jgi:hypothetical protein
MNFRTRATSLAVAFCLWPVGAIAQVTFDQVEAALVALERTAAQAIAQPTVSGQGALALPPVVNPGSLEESAVTTPPPFMPDLAPQGESAGLDTDGIVFLPIDMDVECSANLSQTRDLAQAFAELAQSAEADLLALDRRFLAIEARDVELHDDEELTQCPARFLDELRELQDDLIDFDAADAVQQGETLSICIERSRQGIDRRMMDLSVNTDTGSQQRRLELGGVLQRWTDYGEQVVEAVQNHVSLGRRSQRLATSIQAMQRRCEDLGAY